MLSRELINELQQIMNKNYGLNLSFAQASEMGTTLVSYFTILARMKAENERHERNDNENNHEHTATTK